MISPHFGSPLPDQGPLPYVFDLCLSHLESFGTDALSLQSDVKLDLPTRYRYCGDPTFVISQKQSRSNEKRD